MDAFTIFAVACLFGLALYAWRALYYFNYTNGLMEYIFKAIVANQAPSGRPLKALTTGGRSQWIDEQLKGPCTFQLLIFEDFSHADTTWAGVYFIGSFCASWAMVILESLRAYNRNNFGVGSWTTIPGLLMFNHTPAIYLPFYLAIRLALITPKYLTPDDYLIDPVQLEILPWAFTIGFLIPFSLTLLPNFEFRDISTKHTIIAWWQQWPAWVSLAHVTLSLFWPSRNAHVSYSPTPAENLQQLEGVHTFIFAIAAVTHWVPILACLVKGVSMKALFVPSLPRKSVRARHGWEAAKWTVQWDIIMDTPAMLIWTGVLYRYTGSTLNTALVLRALGYGLLGGPLGSAILLSWERDLAILSG